MAIRIQRCDNFAYTEVINKYLFENKGNAFFDHSFPDINLRLAVFTNHPCTVGCSRVTFFLPTVNGDEATAKAPPTRVLRVAYFCPSDRQPHAGYEVRLLGVTRNIQTFYRNGMKANGFGPTTFPLDMKGDGSLRIIMVNGQQPTSADDRSLRDAKTRIRNEVKEAFAAEGLDFDQEVVLVFQALLVAEPGKTTEVGPFIGGGNWYKGSALVYDDPRLDARLLASTSPDGMSASGKTLGDFNSGYIGGAAHELGHAFGLGHDAENEPTRNRVGRSLMGRGNHDYGEELRGKSRGAFLSAASAFPLSLHPLFTQSVDHGEDADFGIENLSAKFTRGVLRVSGTASGNQTVVGAVAFNDPSQDPSDYDAIGYASKVDQRGRFNFTIPVAVPDTYELRFRIYGEQGQATRLAYKYAIDRNGRYSGLTAATADESGE